MAYLPPLSLLALVNLVVVVASLNAHPASADPKHTYLCPQTAYGSQCARVELPPFAVITIDLAMNETPPYGFKACPELPDTATFTDVKAAYHKCAGAYQSLKKNVLQARKYNGSSLSNIVQPKDVPGSCAFQVHGTNCWEAH